MIKFLDEINGVAKDIINSSDDKPSVTERIENNLYFYSSLNSQAVLTFNKDLLTLRNDLLYRSIVTGHTVTPIWLYIQSGGGNLLTGFSAMDTILKVKETVPVYTVVDGYAASAASLMSIVGTKRYIKKNSYILIHQLSGGAWGTFEEFKDVIENMDKFMKTLKISYKEYSKISMKKLEEILKHDLFFNSDEALEYGLVDEVL